MGLRTAVCDSLGIEVPVVLAGMGGAANPRLAAAVSNAGGLGVFGAATLGPDELRAWIREIRSRQSLPCVSGRTDSLVDAETHSARSSYTRRGEWSRLAKRAMYAAP